MKGAGFGPCVGEPKDKRAVVHAGELQTISALNGHDLGRAE
jgi:hypothetical protein